MDGLAEIKKREREAQVAYIRNLYTTLPEEPITEFEFRLKEAILFDIKRAKKELYYENMGLNLL